MMPTDDELLERARQVKMTPEQKEKQRRSFAYGNVNIENEFVTRETVDLAAESIEAKDSGDERD